MTFILKYSEYPSKLQNGLNQLFESTHNADVTFAIEGQFIKAHQIILSMFSTYFQVLFADNPCQHPIFFMKDVSYPVMKNILQFIYSGEVQIAQEDVPFFVNVANALKIKGLTEMQESTTSESTKRKVISENENMLGLHQFDDRKDQKKPEKKRKLEGYPKEKPFNILKPSRTYKKYYEEKHKCYESTETKNNTLLSINQLDDDQARQVEGKANNMLLQNIAEDPLQLLTFVKVEMNESIDITKPQIEYPVPTGTGRTETATNSILQDENTFGLKNNTEHQNHKTWNEGDLVTVTFVQTMRGKKAIIVGDVYHYHRYNALKNKEMYSCSRIHSSKCNAKVLLTSHDGIVFKHDHKPGCCISEDVWAKNEILERRSYYRMGASMWSQ